MTCGLEAAAGRNTAVPVDRAVCSLVAFCDTGIVTIYKQYKQN